MMGWKYRDRRHLWSVSHGTYLIKFHARTPLYWLWCHRSNSIRQSKWQGYDRSYDGVFSTVNWKAVFFGPRDLIACFSVLLGLDPHKDLQYLTNSTPFKLLALLHCTALNTITALCLSTRMSLAQVVGGEHFPIPVPTSSCSYCRDSKF